MKYDFIRLVNSSLDRSDSSLSRLSVQFVDLIKLLGYVGLDELEVGLMGRKELGANIGIESSRHCEEECCTELVEVYGGGDEDL